LKNQLTQSSKIKYRLRQNCQTKIPEVGGKATNHHLTQGNCDGGHARAAWLKLYENLQQARDCVIAAMSRQLTRI